jgi:hypothetical protein
VEQLQLEVMKLDEVPCQILAKGPSVSVTSVFEKERAYAVRADRALILCLTGRPEGSH